MFGENTKVSERLGIVDVLYPQACSSTTLKTTGWIDMGKHHNIAFVINCATLGSSTATIDVAVNQSTIASSTGRKAISPAKAITQITYALQTSSTIAQCAVLNLRDQELDMANSYRYVQATITPASADATIGITTISLDPTYGPPSTSNASTVTISG